MKAVSCLALTLAVIGALNWGLIGLFRLNLVSWIFWDMTLASRIIYILVGVSGLYLLSFYRLLKADDQA